MIKRIISISLVFLSIFSLFTGCFSRYFRYETPNTSEGKGYDEQIVSSDESNDPFMLDEQREFNSFYFAYTDAEYDFSSLILNYGTSEIKDVYEQHDFMLAYDSLVRCNTYLDRLSMFDEFFYFDDILPGEKHLLDWGMFDVEGYKEKDGDIITAEINDILGEDARWFEAGVNTGDHAYLKAVLDTKNMTLSFKSTLEREGKVVSRTEFELVLLSGENMLFQFFHIEDLYDDDSFASGYAVFKSISDDNYSCIVADLEKDYDYSYESIIGRGKISTEEMSEGLLITHLFTVENRRVGSKMVRGDVN